MTKAPISLQELRRRIYRKAKSDVGWRRRSNEYPYDLLGLEHQPLPEWRVLRESGRRPTGPITLSTKLAGRAA
jgi:hypothetical protein